MSLTTAFSSTRTAAQSDSRYRKCAERVVRRCKHPHARRTCPQLLAYSPTPASATSPGTPGQVAFDAAGNWYFCYGQNQWGEIGPTGYGSAEASQPSW
jgi:hypothetical protein